MTDALNRAGVRVKVLAISTSKHPYIPQAFPSGYLEKNQFETLFVDTSLNVVDAFSALITQDSYNITRFFSPDVDKALAEILSTQHIDAIILESLFVAPYIDTIRRYSKAPVILRSHNLEFTIWHRLANAQKNGLKKTYLRILTNQLKSYETEILNHIDGLIAINSDELRHYKRLGFKGKGVTIPFGINPDEYVPDHSGLESGSIFHLGSMDWQPNQEGLLWFLEEVWPKVSAVNKSLRLYIAGRQMPESIYAFNDDRVTVLGDVPDAKAFMRSKEILIIPLRSGGGMRVKLIEALALEKAVVSTPLGAKGVRVKNNVEAVLARNANDFADAILSLSADKKAIEEMGKAGRTLAEKYYDNTILSEKTVDFLSKLIK
jgi:glycosyltransferase involved in cell wall biosynthesis